MAHWPCFRAEEISLAPSRVVGTSSSHLRKQGRFRRDSQRMEVCTRNQFLLRDFIIKKIISFLEDLTALPDFQDSTFKVFSAVKKDGSQEAAEDSLIKEIHGEERAQYDHYNNQFLLIFSFVCYAFKMNTLAFF